MNCIKRRDLVILGGAGHQRGMAHYADDLPPLPERSGVTPQQFREEIVPAGKPVVLRGIIADWPITQRADDLDALTSFLRTHSASTPIQFSRVPQDQNRRFFYDSENMRKMNFDGGQAMFDDFLDRLLSGAGGDTLYMASTPAKAQFPSIADSFNLPHVPDGTTPRIFIGNQTIISTHNDGSSNIATIAAGHRTFTLFPPEQLINLYPGPLEHTPAGPQLSMVDIADPEADRFPRFAEAMKHAAIGELGPGDGIYIPPLWWHDVRAHDDFNILVNFWWRDRNPYSREPMEAFLLSLLSLRQLEPQERDAWRSMFDYYVFQTSGPPMAHLPEDLQGILGTHSPARAQQIWKFFKGQMQS